MSAGFNDVSNIRIHLLLNSIRQKLLSPDQLEQYAQDGYTLVQNALPTRLLDQLRTVTDEICATASSLEEHSKILDLEPSHTPESPKVRRIKQPQNVHPFYNDLARDDSVLNLIKPILGPSIRLRAGCKINMKNPSHGSAVEWHQDWAFYPHTNQSVLAVGILLDDMNASNGAIRFLAGSHEGPVYSHHSQGAFCGAINIEEEHVDVSAAKEVYATAGSMTIHHARLVHGSEVNRSNSPRRILFYEYTSADAWPLAGIEHLSNFEEFNSRMVCGEPTLEPRMESVPVKMPLPIAPYQGSIYENQRTLSKRYFENT